MVLIGYGASAFDISRDIATEAKEVHIATRKPDAEVRKLECHNNNIWQHKKVCFFLLLFFAAPYSYMDESNMFQSTHFGLN